MKATIIAVITIGVLACGGLAAYYFEFIIPEREIATNCAGYKPDWAVYVECHGVITITDGWDMDYLSLKDHVHQYEVARIYNLNQYIIVGDYLYVINLNRIQGEVSDGVRVEYRQTLYQNGELSTSYYSSIQEIPMYLVINYRSGEVRAYKGVSTVPTEEQRYFIELEKL